VRVMVLPDKMGAEGVKVRVTGTDALPEIRSSEAMPKEERVRVKQGSNQSLRAETLATETGVSRLVTEVPSPTCTKHLMSAQTTSPRAHKTPSQVSKRNYLATGIPPPTRDRPTA